MCLKVTLVLHEPLEQQSGLEESSAMAAAHHDRSNPFVANGTLSASIVSPFLCDDESTQHAELTGWSLLLSWSLRATLPGGVWVGGLGLAVRGTLAVVLCSSLHASSPKMLSYYMCVYVGRKCPFPPFCLCVLICGLSVCLHLLHPPCALCLVCPGESLFPLCCFSVC